VGVPAAVQVGLDPFHPWRVDLPGQGDVQADTVTQNDGAREPDAAHDDDAGLLDDDFHRPAPFDELHEVLERCPGVGGRTAKTSSSVNRVHECQMLAVTNR
jgi:hypothetical protein